MLKAHRPLSKWVHLYALNKTFIPVLIGFISLSLIGLIAIQIYWIKNSIELRDAQFRRNVKMALADVNETLEYQEKMYRMKKHDFGQFLIEYDSIRATLHQELISQTAQTDSALASSELKPTLLRNYDREASDDLAVLEAEYLADKAKFEEELQKNYPFSKDQSEEIARLIFDLSTKEIGSNYLTHYRVSEIDSMIERSLLESGGIQTPYHFGIFDDLDRPELVPERSEAHQPQLIAAGYKFRLLPTDYLNPTTFLHIWFPNQDSYLLRTLLPLLASSVLFMIAIILAFTYTIRTILRQKKISDIKNDFINNMTHELKTPIATISLACQALHEPAMIATDEKRKHYVSMIQDENKRLAVLVDNVLRSAVLDRDKVELNRDDVQLHSIISKAAQNLAIQAENRGGKIQLDLQAENSEVIGDEIHLTNLVINLLDNAIKYSPEKPDVTISTFSTDSAITLSVSDKGLGIKKDDQKRIFEKLYRVPTGNIHNTKGFGLGLSYVKAIVAKHHGTISVVSDFGKGSTFSVELPYHYDV